MSEFHQNPALLYTSTFGYKLNYAKAYDIGMDLPCVINRFVVDGTRRFEINWVRNLAQLIDMGVINQEVTEAIIPPLSWATFPTGIYTKIPNDAWMLILNRSSSPFNIGIHVATGVIDAGYTGELMTRICNMNEHAVKVKDGDRLSQAIIIPRYNFRPEQVDELPKTERGSSGFGSSGGESAVCDNLSEDKRK